MMAVFQQLGNGCATVSKPMCNRARAHTHTLPIPYPYPTRTLPVPRPYPDTHPTHTRHPDPTPTASLSARVFCAPTFRITTTATPAINQRSNA